MKFPGIVAVKEVLILQKDRCCGLVKVVAKPLRRL